MARRYHCGTCNITTAWMGTVDVEHEAAEHRRTHHDGHRPDGESITSNAERVSPKLWGYFLAALLIAYIADKTMKFFT